MLSVIATFLCVIISLSESDSGAPKDAGPKCEYKPVPYVAFQPEVYYINMDKSVARRKNIESHLDQLGLRPFRVRGITPEELYIPKDLEDTWQTRWCLTHSEIPLPAHLDVNNRKEYTGMNKETGKPYTAIIRGLCGRKRNDAKNTGNQIKELGCTSSHLEAMRRAIYSETATSRFALIIEDDVFFPFDVDWNALAHTAPDGFGILQLFNSNAGAMESTWKQYVKSQHQDQDPANNVQLWMMRHSMSKHFDMWSTCAYLIDREAMREVIDAVAYYTPPHVGDYSSSVSIASSGSGSSSKKDEKPDLLNLHIVAGINNPCVPETCCPAGAKGDIFVSKPPCTWAPRGFQADSWLYALTKTYMLTMPLITNGQGTNQSTFHQSHVGALHRQAFVQQRQYVNDMLQGTVKPPVFARAACTAMDVEGM